ncbi:tyrosine-type recombinase/integrase [Sphaerisporangium dianthi]|uniref:Tyrosine-type recombinase/integrase n=1 Tax=Sphaerisporangium dianthi TaxID=1436120 RepID=A0ABV9CIV2_9ACTN
MFAFFHLAAYSGARRGELLNLRWTHVDLNSRQIIIKGSTAVIDGKRVEGTTKGGRSRVVPVGAETVAVLRKHQEKQEEDRKLLGDAWRGKDDYVFTTGWGEPIYPDTVTGLMRDFINRYNNPKDGEPPAELLPYARLHDLRHIHATMLLLAGVSVHVVAARLGHADPAITLRVYAHVIRSAETAVADIFAQALDDEGSSS